MAKFETRALIIIIPFGAALLLGLLFICKHKFYLWTLRKDDSESDTGAGSKVDAKNPKVVSNGAGKLYAAPADLESGNKGAESESDSVLIAQPGKSANRKSFCV